MSGQLDSVTVITALVLRTLYNIGINIVFFNLFSEDAGIIYTVRKVSFPALRSLESFSRGKRFTWVITYQDKRRFFARQATGMRYA